ncbi:hypothetical protein DIPPA_11157 [Diplonema papillatum]|nr:hypothetical protein DIPPA_11157 [Diplonema papillatum]
MSMTTDQATRDSGRTPTDSATTSVWRSRQQKTPKRVSDAMLSRITARVEALVRRRRGGAGLSGGERAQARADIELILQSSKPLSNRDLSLIAGRCCSSERSTPVLGDDGSTVSSVLPPVHTRRTDSSLPNAAGRPAAHLTPADIVSLNSAYRAPSSSCNNNNNYNNNITDDDESSAPERRHYLPSRPVDSSPPAEFHAGRAWALGIKSDVERFHKEQQEVRRAQKLRKNEHRSVLERQMEERRAAAARAREEELRCDAGGEEQRPEDEKLKRLQSDEFREDVLKANEAILHAKLATHRREVEEDQALAKAMAEQLAHDRQRDAMKKQDKRKKMEEMGELMKVRERSMLEIKMKAREQEKAASLKHLSLLEKYVVDSSLF